MKSTRQKYLLIILLVSLSGCVVYHPKVVPASLIKEKGEIQLNGGTDFPAVGVYANVGYGINKFISTQVFGHFSLWGTYHLDFNSGLYKNFNKINIEIYGGYAYGHGNFDEGSAMKPVTNWKGYYEIKYAKFQLIKLSKRLDYGIILKFGYFPPSYIHTIDSTVQILKNQKGTILEPSLFFNLKFTERLSLTINYTNSYINPINKLDKYYPKHYELEYNWYGSIGIGVAYKIKTGHNTSYENN